MIMMMMQNNNNLLTLSKYKLHLRGQPKLELVYQIISILNINQDVKNVTHTIVLDA